MVPLLTEGRRWLREAEQIDHALYAAVAETPTPRLDGTMRWLSHAADYSRLSLASAVVLGATGGRNGRRAAVSGLAALATTVTFVNLVVKPLGQRHRPNRLDANVVPERHVSMPTSASFPSGHTAGAVAFASGAGNVVPLASIPLHGLAAVVGYSRVHTGVHFPGDVVAGALLGSVLADLTAGAITRTSTRSRRRSS